MTVSDLTVKMAVIVFVGVFAGSFMDAISGGGGLICLPAYLLAGLPPHMALGSNKFSACIGGSVSAGRYIARGYADLRLAVPGAVLAVVGAHFGTRLQLMAPDIYLQYLLLLLLPVIAFVVLRERTLPEERLDMPSGRRLAVFCVCSLIIGLYDGFYGPGAGTFYLLAYCKLAKLDVRTASGTVKVVNFASNLGAAVTSLLHHQVFFALSLIGVAASVSGHYIGSGYAIKHGSRIIRPMVIVALVLLAVKVISGFFTTA